VATAVTVAFACLGWTAVATADNPHGTPPGQEKADASATANAQVGAQEQAKGEAKGEAGAKAHAHAGVGVKAKNHAHGGAKASAGAATKTVVAAHGRAGGGVHTAAKPSASVHEHGSVAAATSAQTKVYGNGTTAGQVATAAGFGNATLYGPGNSRPHKTGCGKQMVDVHALKAKAGACGATEEVAARLHGHAHGKLGASGHAAAALAAALGLGVKPSSSTGKNTIALASSNQTKLYGNGLTAGQIATQAGMAEAPLFGPGNSQPHKVLCGTHMVDVHALKAKAGACAAAVAAVGTTASGSPVVASVHASAAAPVAAAATTTTTSSPAAAAKSGVAPAKAEQQRSQGPTAQLAAVKTAVNRAVSAPVRTGTLPFTGAELWLPMALGIALMAGGFALRRRAGTLT